MSGKPSLLLQHRWAEKEITAIDEVAWEDVIGWVDEWTDGAEKPIGQIVTNPNYMGSMNLKNLRWYNDW